MAQANVSRRGALGHLFGAAATATIVPSTIPTKEDLEAQEVVALYRKLPAQKQPHLIGFLRSLTA